MTRVARSIDISEWLTRTEERLSTAERRLAAAARPAQGATATIYGPNLLPNPDFETAGNVDLSGWQNLQYGAPVTGSDAISGVWSYRMLHSAQQPVITREKRSINIRPYAWRVYKGDNTYKSPQGSDGYDHLFQGQFDAVDGNQRCYMWFDPAGFQDLVSSVPGDWVSADLLLFWEHWYWSEGGTHILGAHTVTTPPAVGAVGPLTNSFPNLVQFSWPGRYMWGSCPIISIGGICDRLRDGTFRGFEFGPGPTTNATYYGYARPYDAQLRVTYWKTTNISLGGNTSEVRSSGIGVTGGNVKWNMGVSVISTVPAVATIGVWWKNAAGTVTDVDVGTANLGASAMSPLTGTTGAAFSDVAVDMGCYIKMNGSPPSDGAGGTVPWNYTVDDFVLRQLIAG